MNKLAFFLFPLIVIWTAQSALAQGSTIFPQEKYSELVVVATNPTASSFLVKNSRGEQIKGYVGDFLGAEEAEVVSISEQDVTLELLELIDDIEGNQRELRSRMQLPLSFSYYGKGKGTRKE